MGKQSVVGRLAGIIQRHQATGIRHLTKAPCSKSSDKSIRHHKEGLRLGPSATAHSPGQQRLAPPSPCFCCDGLVALGGKAGIRAGRLRAVVLLLGGFEQGHVLSTCPPCALHLLSTCSPSAFRMLSTHYPHNLCMLSTISPQRKSRSHA